MRLIEQQMCSAVINKNDWRKDNTEVMYSPSRDVCCVYLHKNLIATIDNNSVEVYDGGWQSNTTKSRLNAIINGLCDGYNQGIYQHKFEWFINDNCDAYKRNVIEFEHGYTFDLVIDACTIKLKDVTFTRGCQSKRCYGVTQCQKVSITNQLRLTGFSNEISIHFCNVLSADFNQLKRLSMDVRFTLHGKPIKTLLWCNSMR